MRKEIEIQLAQSNEGVQNLAHELQHCLKANHAHIQTSLQQFVQDTLQEGFNEIQLHIESERKELAASVVAMDENLQAVVEHMNCNVSKQAITANSELASADETETIMSAVALHLSKCQNAASTCERYACEAASHNHETAECLQ